MFFNLMFGNCHTLCIKNQLAGFDDFCVLFLIDKTKGFMLLTESTYPQKNTW